LTILVLYPLVGVAVAKAYGKATWNSDEVRQMIEAGRYNGAQLELAGEQRTIVGAWPVYLLWASWEWLHEWLAKAVDPHLARRQEYDQQMAEYRRLDAMEDELRVRLVDRVAEYPAAFCGCLPGSQNRRGQERNVYETQIQHHTELARSYLHMDHLDRDQLVEDVDGHLKQTEMYLRKAGMWE